MSMNMMREQESRRHEVQIQQLQAELRQLNQSFIIKQEELTRLNRDNERLVAEQREAQRTLRRMEGKSSQLELGSLSWRRAARR